jgi:protein SCO1/2
MSTSTPNRRLLPLLAIGACALAGGIYSSIQLQKMPQPQSSNYNAVTLLPVQRELPELDMLDQDGVLYTRDNLTDRWSLLFMGFTNCGHTCPMTLAKMRTLRDALDGRLDIVFVSVDPGRDTPAIINKYVKGFDASFTGITGAPEQIAALANALGAPYYVDESPDNYTVDHSSALFLIAPSAKLAGVISQPLDMELTTQELAQVL